MEQVETGHQNANVGQGQLHPSALEFQVAENGGRTPQVSHETFKLFLATAPVNWSSPNETIRRLDLGDGQYISCVLWNELFHITGTDIIKSMAYRMECIGRTVTLLKKFEEGIFSDLRNLKAVVDATLEESRSPFLKFLYENQCIRTQKKQKVFYWFSVKHDKLFLDALERDLKRESTGQTPCTVSRVPITMAKSMEMAKALCMPHVPMAGNKQSQSARSFSISTQSFTPRVSSAGLSDGSSQSYIPVLNYSHPMEQEQIPQRFYSPFQQHPLLHPGSPPQGIMTPPIMHQQYSNGQHLHALEHEGYRIMRNEPSLGIHRTDSPLGIYRTDSPAHSLMSQHDNISVGQSSYDGAHVLSSMFNPNDYAAPSSHQQYGGSDNIRYSPYQPTTQNPIPIRRHSSLRGDQSHQIQMQQHQQEDGRIYECPHNGCNRQFKRQEHLNRHFRGHTGERPYTCIVPECRRSFSRSDHLQLHMRQHNESGFRNDDSMFQSFPPHSDFQIPAHSPSFDGSHLEYHPMRSESRLSMHSSFDPLLSIPSSSITYQQQQPNQRTDEIVAAAAAAAAIVMKSEEQNGAIEEGVSEAAKEESVEKVCAQRDILDINQHETNTIS